MNKLLVVLLAVCLVSVHGFVKRDTAAAATAAAAAPAAAPSLPTVMETIAKDLTALGESMQNEMSKYLNPDKMKSDLNSMIDKLNEAVKSVSQKEEAPKA